MKLIARIKLNPTPEQAVLLLQTMEAANGLCDWISEQAWTQQKFRRYDIHNAIYHVARQTSELAAQVVVRCIAKVADAYLLDKETQRTFRPHGSIACDDRILKLGNQQSSRLHLDGHRSPACCLLGDRLSQTPVAISAR